MDTTPSHHISPVFSYEEIVRAVRSGLFRFRLRSEQIIKVSMHADIEPPECGIINVHVGNRPAFFANSGDCDTIDDRDLLEIIQVNVGTIEDQPMDDDNAFDSNQSLKPEINNLIIMYGHSNMTIKELDELACQFYHMIADSYEKHEHEQAQAQAMKTLLASPQTPDPFKQGGPRRFA